MKLVLKSIQASIKANRWEKPLKKLHCSFSLLSLRRTIASPTYFGKLKNLSVEPKQNQPYQLQLDDILIPNAQLSAFVIEMDEHTTKLIQETHQKQDEVLKLKEVNEETLRMVVQL